MQTESENTDILFSSLAEDPDLAELGDEFADEMPMKIDAMQAAYQLENLELMLRLVHQLKGAAGSYGFSSITPFAARLEATLKSSADAQAISVQLEDLVSICNRVRSRVKCHEFDAHRMTRTVET